MEDMDIDLVVDIPDTPDRLAARHINGGKFVRKESNSSISGHSRKSDFMDEERLNRANRLTGRGRVETENLHNRRHHMHPRKTPSNLEEIERHNNSISLSPIEKPYASRNSLLFRKTTTDKNSKDETGHFNGAHHVDKGKATRDADHLAKEMREGKIASNGGSSLHCAPNCSKISNNAYKGKEKIDDNTCKRAGSAADNGRGIDLSSNSQHKMEKEISTSHHSVISPRVTGQKRLVRNGCISPHNIATRLAERKQNSIKAKDGDQNQIMNVVSGGPCLIDISEIVAEDNYCDRVKGKGVLTHPCTSKERDAKIIHLSSSTSRSNNEEANGTDDAGRDVVGCFEGLGGWRSTRNRSRKLDYPFSDDAGRSSGMNNEVGCFVNQQHRNRDVKRDNGSERKYKDACDYQEDWDAAQAASRPVSELDQFSEPRLTINTIAKRPKNGLASRNRGDISGMVSDDSEVVVLGSSGVSSSSSSSRIQSCQRQGILGPILEIDELSPEIRCSESQGYRCTNNDESDARARQVEADEMLARELQEQLYHEAPTFGGGEIDENVAWSLQQEHALGAASSRNQHVSHPRSLSRTNSYRHPLSRSLQNPSNRRGTQARVPTARMSRLRSRIFSRSPAASSRAGNLRFPLDMDLDMRLDILEALEAAVGDFSDMGTASHIHQVQRDFNENDYEMLLALDENNHRHGASVTQINSLPQSTVQTENFDEACAICLETPTIGETIRHLPCLHKFHKDCIDPWLSRKTSCPVCKSSIT